MPKDIRTLTSFQKIVVPAIHNILAVHPQLASDLMHITLDRSWYFVPVKLKNIPDELVGARTEDKTQQIALQDLYRVWFDSKIFGAMNDEQQAKIIMHELLMGVALMRFKSPLDQCYSQIAGVTLDPKTESKYSSLKDDCALRYIGANKDSAIHLVEQDYAIIQALGPILLKNPLEISKPQLDAWLAQNNFRKY